MSAFLSTCLLPAESTDHGLQTSRKEQDPRQVSAPSARMPAPGSPKTSAFPIVLQPRVQPRPQPQDGGSLPQSQAAQCPVHGQQTAKGKESVRAALCCANRQGRVSLTQRPKGPWQSERGAGPERWLRPSVACLCAHATREDCQLLTLGSPRR
jgi:hypothetical protein